MGDLRHFKNTSNGDAKQQRVPLATVTVHTNIANMLATFLIITKCLILLTAISVSASNTTAMSTTSTEFNE